MAASGLVVAMAASEAEGMTESAVMRVKTCDIQTASVTSTEVRTVEIDIDAREAKWTQPRVKIEDIDFNVKVEVKYGIGDYAAETIFFSVGSPTFDVPKSEKGYPVLAIYASISRPNTKTNITIGAGTHTICNGEVPSQKVFLPLVKR